MLEKYEISYSNSIGTLNESGLHAQLKEYYKKPKDRLEVLIDGFVIDIVNKDLLIEIQIQNFAAIKDKLVDLTKNYEVLLVYPIIRDKSIRYKDDAGNFSSKRLSPKHNSYIDMFDELIYLPRLLARPNLSIECILVQINEIRQKYDKKLGMKKQWKIIDRKLIGVKGKKRFGKPNDLLRFIPRDINYPFSNFDLARRIKKSVGFARKITYSLRKMGVLRVVGKDGNTLLFCQ